MNESLLLATSKSPHLLAFLDYLDCRFSVALLLGPILEFGHIHWSLGKGGPNFRSRSGDHPIHWESKSFFEVWLIALDRMHGANCDF